MMQQICVKLMMQTISTESFRIFLSYEKLINLVKNSCEEIMRERVLPILYVQEVLSIYIHRESLHINGQDFLDIQYA